MSTALPIPVTQQLPYFEEAISAEVVNSRMAAGTAPRTREIMEVLVRHLHAAVKEIEPTEEEWMNAIQFLTETGKMCDQWRQEYILLSDVLGVSMLVDAINHRRPSGATPNTVLGPFYVANAPRYANGANICLDGKGEPLLVVGRVLDENGVPVPHATLDIWQTNHDGFYDVQQKDTQPEHNMRGVFESDSLGNYCFASVKPRHYPVPDDGPVGKLMRMLGRQNQRAAHLHMIVGAAGFESATTHIFTPDCPYLEDDAVFGVKRELVGDFVLVSDEQQARDAGLRAPFWKVSWDITLVRQQPVPAAAA